MATVEETVFEADVEERLHRDLGGFEDAHEAIDRMLDEDPLLCLTCTGVVGMTCSCPD